MLLRFYGKNKGYILLARKYQKRHVLFVKIDMTFCFFGSFSVLCYQWYLTVSRAITMPFLYTVSHSGFTVYMYSPLSNM